MTAVLDAAPETVPSVDWEALAHQLGPRLAGRAEECDRTGGFVAENWADLRAAGIFWMGIPAELGGGNASFGELCAVIRTVGRHCASTALALAMHTHPVATNVFKHRRGDQTATRILRRLAEARLVVAGTGANDWLESSGEAIPVEGGFRVSAHKRFVSGAPGAQVFVTSAVHRAPSGPEVIHFSVPFSADGVRVPETWDALGMRGTGSHDVILTDVFVPEGAVVTRRPAGVWHPMWDVVLPTALPLIASAYLGLAEAAAELGRAAAGTKGATLASTVGEMTSALTVARMAVADMVALNGDHGFTPRLAGTEAILARKAIAAEAARQTVELAAELVGGAGFRKGHPMERMVRDVRAMHFHPLPARRQREFSGRVALGLDPV